MKKRDLHIHTVFSDGKSTPEEIVLHAIEKGASQIGFSDHSYTPFDTDYCMSPDRAPLYKECIAALKEKYADKIDILCGIEQDYYSEIIPEGYDYIIGSVHYIKAGEEYLSVDKSAADLQNSVDVYFGGDYLAFAREYYKCVGDVVNKTGADIIGHFDLVCKFNEKSPAFDENDPAYVVLWKEACDKLLPLGKYFEVNVGAVSRGYRSAPYPSAPILRYLIKNGAKLILSGDSHKKEGVLFEFDRWESYVFSMGGKNY